MKKTMHGYNWQALLESAEAQYNLGRMYAYGEGGKRDYIMALAWYLKAAEQGHAEAQFNLGMMYLNGRGVEITAEAYRYHDAPGVQQDETLALAWYHKAAEQGHVCAQFELGIHYAYSRGVTNDHQQAMTWYHKAAENGYAPAQFILGRKYRLGDGVMQDNQQALAWYQKAAEQGHTRAQRTVDRIYANGEISSGQQTIYDSQMIKPKISRSRN